MYSLVSQASGSVTTVVIGAGHAGLAISRRLSARSIDHVVLERGEVANSWRTERWDSLRLLTPNWQNVLPGYRYQGNDPDGFMTMGDITRFVENYADHIEAPVATNTTVNSVTQIAAGYRVVTNQGEWRCKTVVLASGICNRPAIPILADKLPTTVNSISPLNYRNPSQLDEGGVLVVGASATGLQLAQEIKNSGRAVTLAVGEHVRLPRMYRGKDIQWWLDRAGLLDHRIEDEDDITRAQRLPSPQLIGTPERATLDLNTLRATGVSIVGRFAGISDGAAQFSGSLKNCCALADLKLDRLLNSLDDWAANSGLEGSVDSPQRFTPTALSPDLNLKLNFQSDNVKTVIWATGFKPDYSWLHLPVLNKKGKLIHTGGIVGTEKSAMPGLYAMGLSYMRRRKSSFIYGAKDDATDICEHLSHHLDQLERKNRSRIFIAGNTTAPLTDTLPLCPVG